MDRQIFYTAQILNETDLLQTEKNAMMGIAKLSEALFGTNTTISGLDCNPTSPPSLQVQIGAGQMYQVLSADATAYAGLPIDTHQVMQQGVLLDPADLSCPAPTTPGCSVNYLVQAQVQQIDIGAAVLTYFNSANPTQPYTGPGNSGSAQNTQRTAQCALVVKAGTAATTGTQATPSPDAGYVGLYVVTVANGQTTITSSNIKAFNGGWTRLDPTVFTSPWVEDRGFTTLAAAGDHAAAQGMALHITQQWTISGLTDLSAVPQINMMPGGSFISSNGSTLKLPLNFQAGPSQWFYGNVSVAGPDEVVPQWWGAVGDGVTDDYMPVYAALSSLKSAGGTMVLGNKTYAIGTMITIDNSWLHSINILGSGPDISGFKFLSAAEGQSLFFYHNGPDGSQFKDFSMVGSWACTSPYTPVTNNNGFWERNDGGNTNDLVFDNLHVSYFGYDALQLVAVANSTVKNCNLSFCGYEGCLISVNSTNCTVENNTFAQCKWGMDTNGNNIIIRNNIFNRMLPVFQTWGITAERNDPTWDVNNLQIIGNIFNDIGDVAINLSSNYLSYLAAHPGALPFYIGDVLISGNIITVNTTNDDKFGAGIVLGWAEHVTIEGNTIKDCLSTTVFGDGTGCAVTEIECRNINVLNNNIFNVKNSAVQIGSSTGSLTTTEQNICVLHNNISSAGRAFNLLGQMSNGAINYNSVAGCTFVYSFNGPAATGVSIVFNSALGCTTDIDGTNWPTGGVAFNLDRQGNFTSFYTSNASAGLDLSAMGKAFVPPEMTTTQRDALTPVDGMIIYNTTIPSHQKRVSGAWVNF